MTRLGLVAVALVVVLAGCGGGVTQTATQEPVATETPTAAAEQPQTDTAEATPSPTPQVAFPAGLSRDGVQNTTTLVSTHDDALGTENLTVAIDFTLEVDGDGQDVSFRGKVTPSNQRGWMQIILQDGVGTYYNEAGITYANVTQDGQSTYGKEYDVSALPQETRFGADARIENALDAANWSFTGVVTRNGTELRRYVATDVSLPDSVDVEAGDVTADSSGTLLVDANGVVHHVSVTSVVETPDKTVEYGISVTLSDIGSTSIERPEWFWDARDG